jgi:hypothetical protein
VDMLKAKLDDKRAKLDPADALSIEADIQAYGTHITLYNTAHPIE